MITVAVVDDRTMIAQAIASGLKAASFASHILDLGRPLTAQAKALGTDVVVVSLDLKTSGSSGIDLIAEMAGAGLATVGLATGEDRLLVAEALLCGATSVVSKASPFEDLVTAIEACVAGDIAAPAPAERMQLVSELLTHRREMERARLPFRMLTCREREVLVALTTGATPAEISESQFVSLSTVRSHIKAIMRKFEVSSQLKVVAMANEMGLPAEHRAQAGSV